MSEIKSFNCGDCIFLEHVAKMEKQVARLEKISKDKTMIIEGLESEIHKLKNNIMDDIKLKYLASDAV
jgi:hypothetical protein